MSRPLPPSRFRRVAKWMGELYRTRVGIILLPALLGSVLGLLAVPVLFAPWIEFDCGKILANQLSWWGLPPGWVGHVRLFSLSAPEYALALLFGVLFGLYSRHKPVVASLACAMSMILVPTILYSAMTVAFGSVGNPAKFYMLLAAQRLPTVLLLVVPAFWLSRWRSSKRIPPGYCVKCGYDLRASKKVCPECGTAIEPRSPPRARA